MNDQSINDPQARWVRFAPGKPVLEGRQLGRSQDPLYQGGQAVLQGPDADGLGAGCHDPSLSRDLHRRAWAAAGAYRCIGVPFANFIAPGLIVMAMMQNAFANSSFSLLVGKIQGNIVDYLMPPLSTGELIAGLVGAAVTRAFLVGFAVWLAMLLWPGVSVDMHRPELVFWFGLMGSLLLSFLGLLTSIWAEKFDHAAAVTNFVVTPLSLPQRHLLFGPPACADFPVGQPCQSVLLRDLRLSRGIPGRQQFAVVDRGDRSARPQSRACGRSATRS